MPVQTKDAQSLLLFICLAPLPQIEEGRKGTYAASGDRGSFRILPVIWSPEPHPLFLAGLCPAGVLATSVLT